MRNPALVHELFILNLPDTFLFRIAFAALYVLRSGYIASDPPKPAGFNLQPCGMLFRRTTEHFLNDKKDNFPTENREHTVQIASALKAIAELNSAPETLTKSHFGPDILLTGMDLSV